MKRVYWIVVSVMLAASFVLTSCQPAAPGGASSEDSARVVYVVNGMQGDKSFVDSAVRGIRRAQEAFGMDVKVIEVGSDPARWQAALVDAVANEAYDILVVGTWQMAEFLQEEAPKYPEKRFMIYDVAVDYASCDCGNIYSVLYQQNEGSYLAGYYAGLMTQADVEGMNPEKIVGVVGAQPIPVIDDFIVGFKQGAQDAGLDPETGVIVQYVGGWNDPAKGKEIALAMYQQGADIVFQIAGGSGEGVFKAAQESGRYAIGVDSDQAMMLKETNPELAEVVLTSMMKNVDNSLYRAFDMHFDGTLPYGSSEVLGVEEGGVGLAYNEYYDRYTPEDIQARIEQAQQDLLDGKIVVDSAFK